MPLHSRELGHDGMDGSHSRRSNGGRQVWPYPGAGSHNLAAVRASDPFAGIPVGGSRPTTAASNDQDRRPVNVQPAPQSYFPPRYLDAVLTELCDYPAYPCICQHCPRAGADIQRAAGYDAATPSAASQAQSLPVGRGQYGQQQQIVHAAPTVGLGVAGQYTLPNNSAGLGTDRAVQAPALRPSSGETSIPTKRSSKPAPKEAKRRSPTKKASPKKAKAGEARVWDHTRPWTGRKIGSRPFDVNGGTVFRRIVPAAPKPYEATFMR